MYEVFLMFNNVFYEKKMLSEKKRWYVRSVVTKYVMSIYILMVVFLMHNQR